MCNILLWISTLSCNLSCADVVFCVMIGRPHISTSLVKPEPKNFTLKTSGFWPETFQAKKAKTEKKSFTESNW